MHNCLTPQIVVLVFASVLYAYEQCLLCYGYCAEIWYEAALYLQRASETGVRPYIYGKTEPELYVAPWLVLQNTQFKERWAEEAAMLYDRATTMSLSDSLLLHFAFADFEEVILRLVGHAWYSAALSCSHA